MGTNFYYTPDHGQPDDRIPWHIGKRSGAGNGLCSFSFRGHREFLDGSITTWDQWKRIILMGGTVRNEYGVVQDPVEFVAEVESTTVENRRRQYDWIRDNPERMYGMYGVLPEGIAPDVDTADEWLCPDGFSFNFREFS